MSEHSITTKPTEQAAGVGVEQIESSSGETDLYSVTKSFSAPPPAPPTKPTENGSTRNQPTQLQRTATRLQQIQSTHARQAILRSMQNKHGNAFASQLAAAVAGKSSNATPKSKLTTDFSFVRQAIQPQAKFLKPVRTVSTGFTTRTERSGRSLKHPVSIPSFLTRPSTRSRIIEQRMARATARANRRMVRAQNRAQRILARPAFSGLSRVIQRSVAAPVGEIGENGEGMSGEELQELNSLNLPAEVTTTPEDGAVTGSGGGGGSALTEQPDPPAPAVNSSDPASAVATLSATPLAQIPTALGSVDSSVTTFVGQKTTEFAADPPKLKRPSGNGNETVSLGAKPKTEPVKKDVAAKMEQTPKGSDVPTPAPSPTPAPPPNPAAAVKGKSFPAAPPPVKAAAVQTSGDVSQNAAAQADAQKAAEEARRRQIEQIVSQVAGAISSLPTKDSTVNTKPGDPPQLKTEGNADPENAKRDHARLAEEIDKTNLQGQKDAAENMDEDKIYPTVPDETLVSKPQVAGSVVAPQAHPAPALIPGLTPKALSAIAKEEKQSELSAALSKAQSDMTAEKQKQEQQANDEKLKGEQEINKAIQSNSQEQAKTREAAQKDVEKQRQDWTAEQTKLVDEQRLAGQKELDKALVDVETERKKGDEEATRHFAEGEKKAEEERIKGEAEAERHKQEGEAKTQDSGFFDWIADAASSFFEGIKSAIEAAFEAARKAVQAAIDAAKQLAVAAIEAARKAVVGIIQAVGEALIAIGNVLLAAFPELKERFTKLIRDAVNKATEAVNKLAEDLKAGVQKLLDLLGAAILKGLDLLKQGLLAAVSALADTVKAIINTVQALVQVFGDLVEVISHISANPGGWISNLGASVKDGFLNHLPKTMKTALKEWFDGKVQGIIGIEPSNFNLLTRIGLTLANTVTTAWKVVANSLPGMVVQELLTKLATMLIPAAGTIMAIIEGVQAAVSSAAQFIKGLQTFISFLKAVKGGNAGPAFAGAMAQGVVALIEFVYNYIVSKIKTGAAKKVGDAVKKVFGKALKKIDIFKLRRQLKSAAIMADDKANQAEMTVEMKDLASGNSFAEAENAYQTALQLTQRAEAAEKAATIAASVAETATTAAEAATTQATTAGQSADTAIATATQTASVAEAATNTATAQKQEAETLVNQAEVADAQANEAQQVATAKADEAVQNPAAAAEAAAAKAAAETASGQAEAVWEQVTTKADAADQSITTANSKVEQVKQQDATASSLVESSNQAGQTAETKNTEADKATGEAEQKASEVEQTGAQAEQKTGENDGQFTKAEQLEQELQQANETAESLRMVADQADMALVAAGGKSINAKDKKPKTKKGKRTRKPKLQVLKNWVKSRLGGKRNKVEKPKERTHKPSMLSLLNPITRRNRTNQHGSADGEKHRKPDGAHQTLSHSGNTDHVKHHTPQTSDTSHVKQHNPQVGGSEPIKHHNPQPGTADSKQHNPQAGDTSHVKQHNPQAGGSESITTTPHKPHPDEVTKKSPDNRDKATEITSVRNNDSDKEKNTHASKVENSDYEQMAQNQQLYAIHRANAEVLERQIALHGVYVPAHLTMQLEDNRAKMNSLESRLGTANPAATREHDLELQRIHQGNYQELELQLASFGIDAPAHLKIQAEDARAQLAEVNRRLETPLIGVEQNPQHLLNLSTTASHQQHIDNMDSIYQRKLQHIELTIADYGTDSTAPAHLVTERDQLIALRNEIDNRRQLAAQAEQTPPADLTKLSPDDRMLYEKNQELLNIYQRRLQLYEQQEAVLGRHTPQHIIHEIIDVQNGLHETTRRQNELLSEVGGTLLPTPRPTSAEIAGGLAGSEQQHLEHLEETYRHRFYKVDLAIANHGSNPPLHLINERQETVDALENITQRQSALHSHAEANVPAATGSSHSSEINSLQNRLEIQKRNIQINELKLAQFGSSRVPLEVVNQLEESRSQAQQLEHKINQLQSPNYLPELPTATPDKAGLTQPVDSIDANNQQQLRHIYTRNLQHVELAIANFGLTPPINLINQRKEILAALEQLQ